MTTAKKKPILVMNVVSKLSKDSSVFVKNSNTFFSSRFLLFTGLQHNELKPVNYFKVLIESVRPKIIGYFYDKDFFSEVTYNFPLCDTDKVHNMVSRFAYRLRLE